MGNKNNKEASDSPTGNLKEDIISMDVSVNPLDLGLHNVISATPLLEPDDQKQKTNTITVNLKAPGVSDLQNLNNTSSSTVVCCYLDLFDVIPLLILSLIYPSFSRNALWILFLPSC